MGGAIADLVSRVYNLERTSAKIPDFNKVIQKWVFGVGRKDGLMIPNFSMTAKELCLSPQHVIPQDGLLLIVTVMNSTHCNRDEASPRTEVLVWLNGNQVMLTSAAAGSTTNPITTHECGCFTSPVRKGDYFQFSNLTVGKDFRPDITYSYAEATLFGFVS